MRLRLPFIVIGRKRFVALQNENVSEGYRAGYEAAEEVVRQSGRGRVKALSRFTEPPIPKPKRASK